MSAFGTCDSGNGSQSTIFIQVACFSILIEKILFLVFTETILVDALASVIEYKT